MKVRYIREWNDGNTDNKNLAHWIEIQAFNNGVNVAYNKPVFSNFKPNQDVSGQLGIETVVNNNIEMGKYVSVSLDLQRETPAMIMIDLLEEYNIETIQIWHGWWNPNRSYYTVLEISTDGKKWNRIYDYTIEPLIKESESGKIYNLK